MCPGRARRSRRNSARGRSSRARGARARTRRPANRATQLPAPWRPGRAPRGPRGGPRLPRQELEIAPDPGAAGLDPRPADLGAHSLPVEEDFEGPEALRTHEAWPGGLGTMAVAALEADDPRTACRTPGTAGITRRGHHR